MSIVTVSTKGQLVIPAFIRKALGIEPNSRVRIVLSEDKTKATVEPLSKDPIRELRGILEGEPSQTKALLKDRREDLIREEEKFTQRLRRSGLDSE